MEDLFSSRAEALNHYYKEGYEAIAPCDLVRPADADGWMLCEGALTCMGCGEKFFHTSSLEDDMCEHCAAEADSDDLANLASVKAYHNSVL